MILKQYDTTIPLKVTVIDSSTGGAATDLAPTGCYFTMRGQDGNLILENATASWDGQAGTAQYQFKKGDVQTPGEYRGEFTLVFPDGSAAKIPTQGTIHITILPALSGVPGA